MNQDAACLISWVVQIWGRDWKYQLQEGSGECDLCWEAKQYFNHSRICPKMVIEWSWNARPNFLGGSFNRRISNPQWNIKQDLWSSYTWCVDPIRTCCQVILLVRRGEFTSANQKLNNFSSPFRSYSSLFAALEIFVSQWIDNNKDIDVNQSSLRTTNENYLTFLPAWQNASPFRTNEEQLSCPKIA